MDEALERILSATPRTGTARVPLAQAAGRVLAEPVHARLDNPPFDASAMDGYAVRARDVGDGATLVEIGTAQAGAGFAGTLGPGQCVRIFTGAPLPQGADAVVIQEDTLAEGRRIAIRAESRPGENVRRRGNDFSQGDVLLRAGTVLGPAALSLAAAANHAECTIASPPRLALMATGDELIPPGGQPTPDQIVASNSFGLAALFAPFCGSVADHGIIADDRAVLRAAISAALEDAPHILLTTGGASVGEHDYVQDVLRDCGVSIDFWRVAMRPGKPLMFGRKAGTLVFGLPGNPVSALVTAQVFVVPAIRAMLGASAPEPLMLPLAAPLPANGERRHFLRARFVNGAGSFTGVAPIGQTDSSHLSSLAQSQCLIVQPEHDPGKRIGELVEVIAL